MVNEFINPELESSRRETLEGVHASINDKMPISGATHNFYKYPACFAPSFARSIINSFSSVDDCVLDPFMGGGTSIVEGLLLGRRMVGLDINDLAVFSARLKTLILKPTDFDESKRWMTGIILGSPHAKPEISKSEEVFFKHLSPSLIGILQLSKDLIESMTSSRARLFATGVLLRTSKNSIDNTKELPTKSEFIKALSKTLDLMILEARRFQDEIQNSQITFSRRSGLLLRADTTNDDWISRLRKRHLTPKLVLTSPPYPGKHILYNRWQIFGRRESYLPYWIISSKQLKSEGFYTFGYRGSKVGIETYFKSIYNSFSHLHRALARKGLVVQLVAFSDKKTQLEAFLDAMSDAGFREMRNLMRASNDGRVWRDVPNRKWYNKLDSASNKCQEVVLFHSKS